MATVESPPRRIKNLADLLDRLGDIPLSRVRFHPPLGQATEADVAAIDIHVERPCELLHGVLVEKAAMGYRESLLAMALVGMLRAFIVPRRLGMVTGPDGPMRLFPGLVRIPDIAFTAWTTVPGRRVPEEPVPDLAPDLAVEVLSASNTEKEMAIKRADYFRAGVRLVWIIDPADRTARVYTAPDRVVHLDASGTLDGGDVLPGFVLPLRDLFSELDHGEV